VRRLIETEPELELAAVAEDLDGLLAAVEAEKPDVVLTDIRMPPPAPTRASAPPSRSGRRIPGWASSCSASFVDPAYALNPVRARVGTAGLPAQGAGVRHRAAAGRYQGGGPGRSVIDPRWSRRWSPARSKTAESPLSHLTKRELEVLSEMAQGKNNAAIAGALVLTERAVEKHINSIFSKLSLSEEEDAHRRVKAVLLFLSEKGLRGY